MDFIVYNESTGEIVRTGTAPPSMVDMQAQTGEVVIEGEANDLTQYFDIVLGQIVNKPIIPCSIDKLTLTADNIDSITISNLPNPSTVMIMDEGVWEITDGSFEFTIDTIGEYQITCNSSLYLEVGYTINAN